MTPPPGPSTDQRIQTAALLILASVAVAFVLYWLQAVLVPFVLSLFIALGLSPLIDTFHRRLYLPRWIAVLATLLVAVAILALVGFLITISANRLAANAGTYQAQVRAVIDGFLERFPLQAYGVDPDEVVRLPLQAISTVAINIANAIVTLVSQGAIVVIFVGFLLLGGSTRKEPVGGIWGEVESRVKRYIVFKFILSAITAVLVGSILWLLGIELAMAFGLMAFLLNFIPSIGSIVATLLPLPVVLVMPEASVLTVVLAIALPGAVQITIGNVIEPKVMGGELDLHPVTVLLALMIWGALWGAVGMLLAAPITAVMKMMFEKAELTRPVALLFAGRLDELRSDGGNPGAPP
jgi:AI-2 transport protein TqsA